MGEKEDKDQKTIERYVVKVIVEIDGQEHGKFFSPRTKSKSRAIEYVKIRVERNGNKLIKFLE